MLIVDFFISEVLTAKAVSRFLTFIFFKPPSCISFICIVFSTSFLQLLSGFPRFSLLRRNPLPYFFSVAIYFRPFFEGSHTILVFKISFLRKIHFKGHQLIFIYFICFPSLVSVVYTFCDGFKGMVNSVGPSCFQIQFQLFHLQILSYYHIASPDEN